MKSVSILTLVITFALVFRIIMIGKRHSAGLCFKWLRRIRHAALQRDDYNLWPSFTWMLLIFAMLSGGCTGSTSGGIKKYAPYDSGA